jgi:hypothetical protein
MSCGHYLWTLWNISICICTTIICENPSSIFDRCRTDSVCEYCKYVFYISEIKQHWSPMLVGPCLFSLIWGTSVLLFVHGVYGSVFCSHHIGICNGVFLWSILLVPAVGCPDTYRGALLECLDSLKNTHIKWSDQMLQEKRGQWLGRCAENDIRASVYT